MSRIRAAWRATKTLVEKAENSKRAGVADDFDYPLDQGTHG